MLVPECVSFAVLLSTARILLGWPQLSSLLIKTIQMLCVLLNVIAAKTN